MCSTNKICEQDYDNNIKFIYYSTISQWFNIALYICKVFLKLLYQYHIKRTLSHPGSYEHFTIYSPDDFTGQGKASRRERVNWYHGLRD